MCTFAMPRGHALEVLRLTAATAGLFPAEIALRNISAEVSFNAELARVVTDINETQRQPFSLDACMRMGEDGR